jgi:hypothetical protein
MFFIIGKEGIRPDLSWRATPSEHMFNFGTYS